MAEPGSPTPAAVLAHVAQTAWPPGFLRFWTGFMERVRAIDATPREATAEERRACGGPGVTHLIQSVRGVRIGCRVSMPMDAPARAVVVVGHGYGMEGSAALTDDPHLTARGLGVVALRIRGYPGSCLDTGVLTDAPGGWIAHGIESAESWILGDAVADTIQALRAAWILAGGSEGVLYWGESFSGGLGIIASACLSEDDARPQRIVIGLPTFGDWSWRIAHRHAGGSGGEVLRALGALGAIDDDVIDRLRLFDAAVHAPAVRGPALFKLAERDEIVPPETAAAVYNALGAAPGRKWRYVTRTGHAPSPGMEEMRRHADFERLAAEFLDPRVDPESIGARLVPVGGS